MIKLINNKRCRSIWLSASLFVCFLLSACGDDAVEGPMATNVNRNTTTPQSLFTEDWTPASVKAGAMHGMEIPSLKTGNINSLIVHTLSDGTLNYCVGYNTKLKANCWTAFKWYAGFSSNNKGWNRNNWRNGETFNGYGGTGDPFQPDPVLPAEYRLTSEDYDNWSYQRGHILGSADRLNSKEANGQTFYLSNIMPQLKDFNEHGIWWNLESWLRSTYDQSSFRDTLYVVKGGTIAAGNYSTTGSRNQMVVPKYYYMAILAFAKKYAKTNGGYYAIAFWMEHKANWDEVSSKYAISIDELEKRTGIDFFCNLPDDIENAVEKGYYLTDWKLK